MAKPTTRDQFIEYCLRKLGKPVLDINVDYDQIQDRVDQALSMYADYHYDASEKIYYKQEITSQIKADKYFTLPENIMGAVRIFQIGNMSTGSADMFNIQYQIALNDLYTLTNVSMVPYYMAMEHLTLLSELLIGQKLIRYQRHNNRLYIDMNWNNVREGQFLIVECHGVIDPEVYTDIWSDRWLQNYCTALIKEQWGTNLTKFTGLSLPGNVQFNGERILSDAKNEIEKYEEELKTNYAAFPEDMMG